MVRPIHDQHAHFMMSVWGKFYPVTDNYKALGRSTGCIQDDHRTHPDWLNHEYAFYDVFNATARRMFWEQVNRALFTKAWMRGGWMRPSPTLSSRRRRRSTTAPRHRSHGDRTGVAGHERVPLMNSEAVYDGQRSIAPDQRVFILTRSGFAGIQRYGTVTWSGDITSTFQTLRKQIVAGLGFSISGTPYWTTTPAATRWSLGCQGAGWRGPRGVAGAECAVVPVQHLLSDPPRPRNRSAARDVEHRRRDHARLSEPVEVRPASLLVVSLYLLACGRRSRHADDTLMRPLVMDFRGDPKARNISDQYMFGPALLVNPVTEYKARTRRVYLPAGSSWYNFWTGQRTKAGRSINADAPYDRIPLFVRSGSIVPVGPEQQYIGAQRRDPHALRLRRRERAILAVRG